MVVQYLNAIQLMDLFSWLTEWWSELQSTVWIRDHLKIEQVWTILLPKLVRYSKPETIFSQVFFQHSINDFIQNL